MTKLSLEDKIMGRTEPLPPTDLQLKAFTNETKYLVYAEGSDNKKVVTGVKIGRILSMEKKQLITNGEKQVKANGLLIERIEEETEQVECTSEQVTNQVTNQVTEQPKPKPKRKRAK